MAHPHLSQALLASGAQQPQSNQQQPQTVQVILKEDLAKGVNTSSSIIKSLLATKVTVGGDSVQNSTTTTTTSISANQILTASQVLL